VSEHADGARSRNVQPRSLCHIVNNTPNLERITKFYTDVLGFRVSDWSGQQMAFLRTDSKHHNISFNAAAHASVNHVAYLVSGVDEVMRGISNLRKHGIEPSWGPGAMGRATTSFVISKIHSDMSPSIRAILITSRMSRNTNPECGAQSRVDGPMGVSAPPSPELREAMTGEPDPGWAA